MATRCTARHPMYPAQVRCELPRGHADAHAHSFYARYWSDDAPTACAECGHVYQSTATARDCARRDARRARAFARAESRSYRATFARG